MKDIRALDDYFASKFDAQKALKSDWEELLKNDEKLYTIIWNFARIMHYPIQARAAYDVSSPDFNALKERLITDGNTASYSVAVPLEATAFFIPEIIKDTYLKLWYNVNFGGKGPKPIPGIIILDQDELNAFSHVHTDISQIEKVIGKQFQRFRPQEKIEKLSTHEYREAVRFYAQELMRASKRRLEKHHSDFEFSRECGEVIDYYTSEMV